MKDNGEIKQFVFSEMDIKPSIFVLMNLPIIKYGLHRLRSFEIRFRVINSIKGPFKIQSWR